MDIIKIFLLNNTNYEVKILIENGKPLFRANQIAKILDIKCIYSSIKNFTDNEKVQRAVQDSNGIEQETNFLTKHGLYRLMLRSNKNTANIFRSWIYNVLDTIDETGKYELQEEIRKIKEENKYNLENLKSENEIIKRQYEEESLAKTHQIMMDSFDNKNVVYFLKIKEIGDKILIKIGSTQDIKTRGRGLKSRFGCDVVFLKVFALENYENFERFLLGHSEIKKFLYTDNSTYGINNSTECFLMPKDDVDKAINIASRNINLFNGNEIIPKKTMRKSIDELRNEFKTELENIKDILQNKQEDKETKEEIKEDKKEEEIQYESKRGICTELGQKIQRYSEDGKELLETYKSSIYVLRDSKLPKTSRNGITDAVNRNSVYVGYRWAILDKNLPDDTVQKLKETVVIKTIKKGYICELNEEKNKILKVYSNQKDLAQQKNQKSSGWISTVIKQQKFYNGSYYLNWVDCSDELQAEYLKDNELPELIDKKPHQILINRLDSNTKEVLHTYSSLSEVTTKYKMTRRTLYSAINGDLEKRGFKWGFA